MYRLHSRRSAESRLHTVAIQIELRGDHSRRRGAVLWGANVTDQNKRDSRLGECRDTMEKWNLVQLREKEPKSSTSRGTKNCSTTEMVTLDIQSNQSRRRRDPYVFYGTVFLKVTQIRFLALHHFRRTKN